MDNSQPCKKNKIFHKTYNDSGTVWYKISGWYYLVQSTLEVIYTTFTHQSLEYHCPIVGITNAILIVVPFVCTTATPVGTILTFPDVPEKFWKFKSSWVKHITLLLKLSDVDFLVDLLGNSELKNVFQTIEQLLQNLVSDIHFRSLKYMVATRTRQNFERFSIPIQAIQRDYSVLM